jgi:hypothetical protein
MKPEENMYSAADIANLDDDPDNDLPLFELGRRSLAQDRSDGPWSAIKNTVEEEEDNEEQDECPIQDTLLQVSTTPPYTLLQFFHWPSTLATRH